MSRVRVQTARKHYDGRCLFCGAGDYETLQCHRIVPGTRYTFDGSVTLCASCHCKVTAGTIAVVARRLSTAGVVYECVIGGETVFVPERRGSQ